MEVAMSSFTSMLSMTCALTVPSSNKRKHVRQSNCSLQKDAVGSRAKLGGKGISENHYVVGE